MKIKPIFALFALISIFLVLPSAGFAANVTLAWDEVTGDDIAGYNVYAREAGESYDYDYPEKQVETTQVTLTGFDSYESYYFVVRAVDASGNESGDSNEVYWDPGGSSTSGDNAALSDGDASSDSSSSSGGCFISDLIGG